MLLKIYHRKSSFKMGYNMLNKLQFIYSTFVNGLFSFSFIIVGRRFFCHQAYYKCIVKLTQVTTTVRMTPSACHKMHFVTQHKADVFVNQEMYLTGPTVSMTEVNCCCPLDFFLIYVP